MGLRSKKAEYSSSEPKCQNIGGIELKMGGGWFGWPWRGRAKGSWDALGDCKKVLRIEGVKLGRTRAGCLRIG
jgi:hypothetical protein